MNCLISPRDFHQRKTEEIFWVAKTPPRTPKLAGEGNPSNVSQIHDLFSWPDRVKNQKRQEQSQPPTFLRQYAGYKQNSEILDFNYTSRTNRRNKSQFTLDHEFTQTQPINTQKFLETKSRILQNQVDQQSEGSTIGVKKFANQHAVLDIISNRDKVEQLRDFSERICFLGSLHQIHEQKDLKSPLYDQWVPVSQQPLDQSITHDRKSMKKKPTGKSFHEKSDVQDIIKMKPTIEEPESEPTDNNLLTKSCGKPQKDVQQYIGEKPIKIKEKNFNLSSYDILKHNHTVGKCRQKNGVKIFAEKSQASPNQLQKAKTLIQSDQRAINNVIFDQTIIEEIKRGKKFENKLNQQSPLENDKVMKVFPIQTQPGRVPYHIQAQCERNTDKIKSVVTKIQEADINQKRCMPQNYIQAKNFFNEADAQIQAKSLIQDFTRSYMSQYNTNTVSMLDFGKNDEERTKKRKQIHKQINKDLAQTIWLKHKKDVVKMLKKHKK